MKEWLLKFPVARGALLGAAAVAGFNYLTKLVLFLVAGGPFSLKLIFWELEPTLLLPNAIMGAVLGAVGGSAYRNWRQGLRDQAVRSCRVWGWVCTAVGFWNLWERAYFPSFGRTVAYYGWWHLFKAEFMSVLLNSTPLQAAILVCAVGYLLPRRERDRMQVTENLRL